MEFDIISNFRNTFNQNNYNYYEIILYILYVYLFEYKIKVSIKN